MFRKIIALALAPMALVGGALLAVAAPAASAEAHTPTASATCAVLTVKATQYEVQPEWSEQVLTDPGQPYIAPTYRTDTITPEVPEVSHVEYLFKHRLLFWQTKWQTDPNWNANDNDSSLGWYNTGETRTVIDTPYQAAVTEVVEVDPGQPEIAATYETVVHDADATPNTVLVTIDGTVVEDAEFGTAFAGTYTFNNKHVAHGWAVTITAWNDPAGANGWTKTLEGTTTPCYDTSLRPGYSHSVDCNTVTMVFDNPTKYAFAFDYRVDGAAASGPGYGTGEVYQVVNVPAGTSQTRTVTFVEDTGMHEVAYRLNLGAERDWYLPWVNVAVDSDCAANPEAVPPTWTEWVDGEVDCDTKTVAQTRVRTDTTWTSTDGEWVATTAEVTEEQTRPATAEECPAPPVDEPKDEDAKPVAVATGGSLPFTGVPSSTGIVAQLAALLSVLGAAGITGTILVRRRLAA